MMGRGDAITGTILWHVPFEEKKEEGGGTDGGGVPATMIAMTTNAMIGRPRPHSQGGGDVVSALPGTNRTMLNYNSIPTSLTEQRKHLRKGGLCWDGTFVLGEHIACVALAKWNGKGQGGGGGGSSGGAGTAARRRVVELGTSTGLCSLMMLMGPDCTI
jgi:hypothetical protein